MKCKLISLLSALLLVSAVQADDTELFVTEISVRTGYQPQILIIFDNSGSMASSVKVKQSYDPDIKYAAEGALHSTWNPDEKAKDPVYWVKGDGIDAAGPPVPSGPSDWNRFEMALLNCEAARKVLFDQGFFTGYLRQYKKSGKTGFWAEFPNNNGLNQDYPIDCYEDIAASDPTNAGQIVDKNALVDAPEGFPVDGKKDGGDFVFWDNSADYVNNTEFGRGEVVTLYLANYLRWYHNEDIALENRSKLDVAKETINEVVSSTLSADFGLEIFNNEQGGRIVRGVYPMDEADRKTLTDTIDSLEAETWTPLCESLYEAYRYFSGGSVWFGNYNTNRFPKRDSSIINSNQYLTPFKDCEGSVYVILVTDGAPTRDTDADNAVRSLPANPVAPTAPTNYYRNYLEPLAEWMYNNDISDKPGFQRSTLYTIGFGDITDNAHTTTLLKRSAEKGGGKYFAAKDPSQLRSKLQSAVIEILKINANITSPGVTASAIDRTEVLDNLYYTLFKPSFNPRWTGNLKKLRLKEGSVVGRDGNAALRDQGGIRDDARTFWTKQTAADGSSVDQGGVVEYFANLDGGRVMLFDKAATGPLFQVYQSSFKDAAQTRAGSEDALAAKMGVSIEQLDAYIKWHAGFDVDDENEDGATSDLRLDLMGDPMHARPAVINYGNEVIDNPDLRILVGTNAGVLHMFEDKGDDVAESWAFYPYDFLQLAQPLRDNVSAVGKQYGFDLSPTIFRLDANNDGRITTSGSGDKVWAFVGMRRGGTGYIALDITDPDSPSVLWQKDVDALEYMGQSWSKPVIGYLAEHKNDKGPRPILFFGAGYDINKDNKVGITPDSAGRGVYLLDAETGEQLMFIGNGENADLILPIEHGMAAELALMDSNFDSFVDRIYAADTGGAIWRIDLPSIEKASGYKFAQLGVDANQETPDMTQARRFFVKPTIVRSFADQITQVDDGDNTVYYSKEVPVDYLIVGTGNVTHPLETSTKDHLYIIEDPSVSIRAVGADVPEVVELTALFDIETGRQQFANADTPEEQWPLLYSYAAYQGCYYSHEGVGEKVTAPASVIDGTVFHYGFTPVSAEANNDNECRPSSGTNILYGNDLCGLEEELISLPAGELPSHDTPPYFPPPPKPPVDDGGEGDGDNGDEGGNDVPCEGDECADQEQPPEDCLLTPAGCVDPGAANFRRVIKVYSVKQEQE